VVLTSCVTPSLDCTFDRRFKNHWLPTSRGISDPGHWQHSLELPSWQFWTSDSFCPQQIQLISLQTAPTPKDLTCSRAFFSSQQFWSPNRAFQFSAIPISDSFHQTACSEITEAFQTLDIHKHILGNCQGSLFLINFQFSAILTKGFSPAFEIISPGAHYAQQDSACCRAFQFSAILTKGFAPALQTSCPGPPCPARLGLRRSISEIIEAFQFSVILISDSLHQTACSEIMKAFQTLAIDSILGKCGGSSVLGNFQCSGILTEGFDLAIQSFRWPCPTKLTCLAPSISLLDNFGLWPLAAFLVIHWQHSW